MATQERGLRQEILGTLESQPQATVTLLSSLLAVQDELGYVPEEAIEEVASFTGSTINDVWGVASFYTNFRFTPPGAHVVEVCWGPSCHVQGAMETIGAVFEALGLDDEGDTKDGAVTLRYNTCLGACSQGPVISVDHHLIGRLSPDGAREALRFSSSPGEPGEQPAPVEGD